MSFKRADRVGELILVEMSNILLRSVKDPRLSAVTITAVKVTDDLRNARIYFVEMGQDELNEEIMAGLTRARGFVRRELGHRLGLRFVPEILFVHDKSFGYGNRIERLLVQIAEQEETHD
jgi:ribosome-binding factor A